MSAHENPDAYRTDADLGKERIDKDRIVSSESKDCAYSALWSPKLVERIEAVQPDDPVR
jgi:hypothetical protein